MRADVFRLLCAALSCTLLCATALDLSLPNPANIFRLKDVVESNPILKKLSMFSSDEQFEDITIGATTDLPASPIIVYSQQEKVESAERKFTTGRRKQPAPGNTVVRHDEDNFNDDYRKLNATLFREAIPPSEERPMRTNAPPGHTTKAAVDQFFADSTTTTVEPFTATIPFSYEDLDANWIDENNSQQPPPTTPSTVPIEVTRFPTFARKNEPQNYPNFENFESFVAPEATTPFDVDEQIFSTTSVAEFENTKPE